MSLPLLGCGAGSSTPASDAGVLPVGTLGTIRLLSHAPANGATQVAVATPITLQFDAPIVRASLSNPETGLRCNGELITGTFAVQGDRVTFQPSAPLRAAAEYCFTVSALTCDAQSRILDVEHEFRFRTHDAQPPRLLALDVAEQATQVERTRSFTWTFDEPLDPSASSSCTLREANGQRVSADVQVNGNTVTLQPLADLVGDAGFVLEAGLGVKDVAGNALSTGLQTAFRTQPDTLPPTLLRAWPTANQVSPAVQPELEFDEAMPTTLPAGAITLQDQSGSAVPMTIVASADQRTLRLLPSAPLLPQHGYQIHVAAMLLQDRAGNALANSATYNFQTGTDSTPPELVHADPSSGANHVPVLGIVKLTFSEALDASSAHETNVRMTVNGAPVAVVVEPAGHLLQVTPILPLPVHGSVQLTADGGPLGLRDVAGNALAAPITLAFQTSSETTMPTALLMPGDMATNIPTNARMSVVFDSAMDLATLDPSRVWFTDDFGNPLPGTFTQEQGGKAVRFAPTHNLAPLTYYRITVLGGSLGVLRRSGSGFATDQLARFRTGIGADYQPPSVMATLEGIPENRSAGLITPPSGFILRIDASDLGANALDMSTLELRISGPSGERTPDTLFALAEVQRNSARVLLPETLALDAGAYVFSVSLRDLCGNQSNASPRAFTVLTPDSTQLPFERTQLVWMRTDLDRDGNGRADFDDDLLRLGLMSEGDPLHTNALMRDWLRMAIVQRASGLFGRGAASEWLDAQSVNVRICAHEPLGAQHTQMAVGGMDPEGAPNRGFGAASTGILGRAYYDYRNNNYADRNTTSSPGLGIFPGEMWLYQTRLYQQTFPSYQTAFTTRFRPLCPAMGGMAVGMDAVDGEVLAATFDLQSATMHQLMRHTTIADAVADWADVVGILLAHEVGHSLGLVAPGPAPAGLYGDTTLHNSFASASEVMAASVGYEAMTTLDYRFRDLDLAYLRQRIVLR